MAQLIAKGAANNRPDYWRGVTVIAAIAVGNGDLLAVLAGCFGGNIFVNGLYMGDLAVFLEGLGLGRSACQAGAQEGCKQQRG